MTLALALALGLVAADAAPDLHLTAAEAGRAVVGPDAAARALLAGPEGGRTWFSPMSRTEGLAALAVIGLGVVDWGQTVRFTQRDAYREFEESNPILGRRPSRGAVNAYFPLALGLYALGVWALPSPYRDVLLVGGLGVEGRAVASNALDGIAPTAPWR